MERERKRKKVEKGEGSGADKQMKTKGRASAGEEVAADGVSSPTEEEVEEFFTILKRMREAAKYFEKGVSNSKGGADMPRVVTAVETATDGFEVAGKRVVKHTEFDLNAVPEAESSLV